MSDRLSTDASTTPAAAAVVTLSIRPRSTVSKRDTTHPRIAPKPMSPITPKLASASAHKGVAAPVPGMVASRTIKMNAGSGLDPVMTSGTKSLGS
jgi:hypothetical protein